jgi:short-subunit dehydrogenase
MMNVLMTGASGAIGKELARGLARQGHTLLCVSRDESAASELLKSLSIESNQRHQMIIADINKCSCREKIQREIEFTPVDMLINLAGINQFCSFKEQTDAQIEQIIQTNLVSSMLLTKQLLTYLNPNRKAVIINVGSTLGAIGHPGYAVYCASKFALRGFSEALERELSDSAIEVKYFAPRTTESTINSHAAMAMNKAMGNKVDSVEYVVEQFISFIKSNDKQRYLGWPEKLFVKVNALLPSLVSIVLKSKLPQIKGFFNKAQARS